MARIRFTLEQIIIKLREAEVLVNQGSTVIEASRKLGISEQTFYRWKPKQGGLGVSELRRLK